MGAHGSQKASITVETALVMPIVFGALVAVLFLILLMFQNTITQAFLDMGALRWTNFFYADSGSRDNHGYITGGVPAKSGLSVYDVNRFPGINGAQAYAYEKSFAEGARAELNSVHFLTKTESNYGFDYYPKVTVDISNGNYYLPSGPTVALKEIWMVNTHSPFGVLGNNALNILSTAPVIKPGQYIRETDSKCAYLTARITVWNDALDLFVSSYLADLFTKDTIH